MPPACAVRVGVKKKTEENEMKKKYGFCLQIAKDWRRRHRLLSPTSLPRAGGPSDNLF